jgi:predicted phosphodiesterase
MTGALSETTHILVLSDLHFEHHRDHGRSFIEALDPSGVDVVVVAGDLAPGDILGPALERICSAFAASPVVYVAGNHEYYGCSRPSVHATVARVQRGHAHLKWLDCGVAVVGGQRFLGAALWFRRPPDVAGLRAQMHDFKAIADLESWVYEENARAIHFLETELRRGDVVVTHHLPTFASVSPRWTGSPLNAFFVCDVEGLMRERGPALWVHGHTHESVDTVIGATRVVSNPFGYVRIDENPAFDGRKLVEVRRAIRPGDGR